MPIILISVVLVLLITIVFVLFFVFRRAPSSGSNPSFSVPPDKKGAPSHSPLSTSFRSPLKPSAPPFPPSSHPNSFTPRQTGSNTGGPSFSDRRVNQVPRTTRYDRPTHGHYSGPPIYHTPSPREFAQHTPARSTQNRQAFYELAQVYDRGMQVTYDVDVDAIHLILINVVMKTPDEVAIAFDVCTRKIQRVLRWQGKQRGALLVDIAGLVIGGEATTIWGQSLKACWDKICVVVGKDLYLAAHYNSKADQPNQEQLLEKLRRIQITTCAVLNDFQSNIFDTREEAIAFLRRMRELKAS